MSYMNGGRKPSIFGTVKSDKSVLLWQMRLDENALLATRHALSHEEFVHVLGSVLLNGTNWTSRHACDHRAIGDIVGNDRASAYDAITANGNAGHDCCIHTNVAVIANNNTTETIAIRIFGILIAKHPASAVVGGNFNAARDAHVVSNSDEIRLGTKVITIENFTPPPDSESLFT